MANDRAATTSEDRKAASPGERPVVALDERKSAILRTVVQEYIDTAQPVGSAHVARTPGLGVSSATVRHEMALLEQEGFLAHPHTSAGRIPTDKGYRFFVDQCRARPGALGLAQQQQVADFFTRAHGQLGQMLTDTTRLLANLTHYAALVVAPPNDAAVVRSVQIVVLGTRLALVVVVLSDGSIDKASMELADDVDEERLAAAARHLNDRLRGQVLSDEIAVAPTGDPVTNALVDQACRALLATHGQEADQVFVGGASQMAATFDAVDTVRQVLAILEEQYVVVALVREALHQGGMAVSIGAEHGVESLAECSIVAAPYEVEGIRLGTIGVLGPTRMNYPQAMAAVAAVSNRLGRHLRES